MNVNHQHFQYKKIIVFMQRRRTYIMHFLETARVLAGRKVNVLYDPGLLMIYTCTVPSYQYLKSIFSAFLPADNNIKQVPR